MEQQALFHDSLYDALKDCVRAMGEPKAVAKATQTKVLQRTRTGTAPATAAERKVIFEPPKITHRLFAGIPTA